MEILAGITIANTNIFLDKIFKENPQLMKFVGNYKDFIKDCSPKFTEKLVMGLEFGQGYSEGKSKEMSNDESFYKSFELDTKIYRDNVLVSFTLKDEYVLKTKWVNVGLDDILPIKSPKIFFPSHLKKGSVPFKFKVHDSWDNKKAELVWNLCEKYDIKRTFPTTYDLEQAIERYNYKPTDKELKLLDKGE